MALQRYVVANRRSGKFNRNSKLLSRALVATTLEAMIPRDIVSDTNPVDPFARRIAIIEADPAEMAARAADASPDLIIEPEILHWPDLVPPREFLPVRREAAVPLAAGIFAPISLTVTGAGRQLPNAAVTLYTSGVGRPAELKGLTDANGICRFQIPLGSEASVAVVVPAGGFWAMVVRGAALAGVIDCPPLPTDGPLGWWHHALGIDAFDAALGAGIKIGVADTGVGPHPNLAHVTLAGAYINNESLASSEARDVDVHGTHVAGTIGARPARPGDYAGIAPGCDLFVARIFSGPEAGASNADIANAIDALSINHGVDVINLSLGTTTPSQIVRDAIIDASERGTLCVCAAGNDAGAVNYPAAFQESCAVAAAGLQGWGPPGSLSASRLPLEPSLFGTKNLFAANFTSHGDRIDCAGPGVGVIAPVPNLFGADVLHGALDGTSMASPAVCGALAVLLSRNPTYRALPRDMSRSEAARGLLMQVLRDVGLPTTYAGRGMPTLQAAVS
jgi:subtilisin family serine protease